MRLHVCQLQQANSDVIKHALDHLARAGLPEDEYTRLRDIRNERARAASVGARLALLWALTDDAEGLSVHGLDELPPAEEKPLSDFCRTEHGAPCLGEGDPAISFAHSDRLAVCALSHKRRIGVDIEPLDRRIARAEDIAARYFSKGERALLADATDRDLAFLRIWTQKEALGKALGTGLNADAERLDTTAYPDDCFFEHIVEGEMVSGCVLI